MDMDMDNKKWIDKDDKSYNISTERFLKTTI